MCHVYKSNGKSKRFYAKVIGFEFGVWVWGWGGIRV
jgi:hypothetical protein